MVLGLDIPRKRKKKGKKGKGKKRGGKEKGKSKVLHLDSDEARDEMLQWITTAVAL